jgi:protein-L-isoaspartate(D-aspartate) O-methyltransferase
VLVLALIVGCHKSVPAPTAEIDRTTELRENLVAEVQKHETVSARTLDAMRRVPRHLFAPNLTLEKAYEDDAQPIGFGQTISQPSIVAIMTDALELSGKEKVLEIGTGSGYQAAVLSLLAAKIFSIEIVPELGQSAEKRLRELGYANVHVRIGDGYAGWPDEAPFDRIILTAAPETMPPVLLAELAEGGTLVAPLGARSDHQRLLRLRKKNGAITQEDLGGVRFVPMVPGSH